MNDTATPLETGPDADETAPPSSPAPSPRQSPRTLSPGTKQFLLLILGITVTLFLGVVIYIGMRAERTPTLAEQVPEATRAYYNQCAQDVKSCENDYVELTDGTVIFIQADGDFDRFRTGGDAALLTIVGFARNDGTDAVRYAAYACRHAHRCIAPTAGTSPPAPSSLP